MGRDADGESEPDDGFQFIGDEDAAGVDDTVGADADGDAGGFNFGEAEETAEATDPTGDTEILKTELTPDAAAPSGAAPVVEQPTEPRVGAGRTAVSIEEPTHGQHDDFPTEHGDDGRTEHVEQHDHHPVVEDWPRGVGEGSWWPIVTAVGAAAIYVSVALWLLGRGRNSLLSPAVGPTLFLGAVGLTLFGVYGWLYHGFVAHFWTRGTNRLTARSLRWGMLLFVVSEIATFGALFAFYFYIRAGTWPPADAMAGGVDLLNVLVVANTAVLLLSSLTVHFAHHALAHGNRKRFTRLLSITVGLGLVFLVGQAVEYHRFINREGFDWTSGVLGSAFFGLTGLHGGHVAFGALLLTITLVRGKNGQFDEERDVSLALVSLYWHFVDVVWLFLVAVLYVGASFGG